MIQVATRVRTSGLAISLAIVCGCANSPAEPDTDTDEVISAFGEPGCFHARQVTGFKPLDRSNLIVYAPTRSSAYHVRIRPPARELSFANRIAFDSSGTRICGYAGEGVVFDLDSMARKYFVTDVYKLDAEGARSLIDEFNAEINIDPQSTSGAEIEREIEPEPEKPDE